MLVAACGGGGLTGPPSVAPVSLPPASTLGPPSSPVPVTSVYLTSCEQRGSTVSLCRCTLSWLEQNVSGPQFARDVTALQHYDEGQTSKLPPDVVKAYAECPSSS
jgi:hypothetical protein